MALPQRVVVVHGYAATPADHWFPWLRDELAARGVGVEVLALPAPDAPERASWERVVGEALADLGPHTLVVTHSLGTLTTLRVLADRDDDWTLGGLVMVAGFTDLLAALPNLDAYIGNGTRLPDATRVGRRVMTHSDDDVYVPPAASVDLARRLDAEIVVVPGAGHFLAGDGVTSLPQVLDAIDS